MYPRIPWELVEDPSGSGGVGHTLGIITLGSFTVKYKGWTYAHDFISVSTANQRYSLARQDVSSAKTKHIRFQSLLLADQCTQLYKSQSLKSTLYQF